MRERRHARLRDGIFFVVRHDVVDLARAFPQAMIDVGGRVAIGPYAGKRLPAVAAVTLAGAGPQALAQTIFVKGGTLIDGTGGDRESLTRSPRWREPIAIYAANFACVLWSRSR